MIDFDIRNRFTGKILATAKINCKKDEKLSLKLRLATEWAIKANADLSSADLHNADLSSADLHNADLSNAGLRSADLSRANLHNANLMEADLRSADLHNANLHNADLSRADLRSANLHNADLHNVDLHNADLHNVDLHNAGLILCGARSDNYRFYAHIKNGTIWIKAGCRHFSIKDAAAHWKTTRGGTSLGEESLAILSLARNLVKIRGLK